MTEILDDLDSDAWTQVQELRIDEATAAVAQDFRRLGEYPAERYPTDFLYVMQDLAFDIERLSTLSTAALEILRPFMAADRAISASVRAAHAPTAAGTPA